jgi:L-fucose isomerase-like protein
MDKTSVLGFYSLAHPRETMVCRLENAVENLRGQIKDTELDVIGFFSDSDISEIDQTKKRMQDCASSSSSIIIIFAGWAQSLPVFKLVDQYLHLPIIIWALAGYYTEKGLIAPAAAAGASLLKNTLDMLGIKYFLTLDNLKDEAGSKKVALQARVAGASKHMKELQVASIGYACSNLYPFMYDGNLIKKYIGLHVDNLELMELERFANLVEEKEIKTHKETFLQKVKIEKKVSDKEIDRFSRYSIALDKLIKIGGYSAITMKCGNGPGDLLGFTPCMLLSYIDDAVEAICECDVYNLILQLILRKITGKKATFLEVFEFYPNSVLMASCGFAPFSLCADHCIHVSGHDWGGVGGIMNTSGLKTGGINLLNLSVKDGKMLIQLFHGDAKTPENFQEEGWTGQNGPKIPSLEIFLDSGIDVFINNIRGPHYIAAYGDISTEMKIFCNLKGINLKEY